MRRIGIRRLAKLGMMGLPALGLACSQVPVAGSTVSYGDSITLYYS